MIASSAKFTATTTSAQLVASGARALVGFAVRETTGTAGAVIRLWDGTTNSGPAFIPVSLAASESDRDWFGASVPETGGIAVTSGAIYLEVLSGSVEGSVFYEAVS